MANYDRVCAYVDLSAIRHNMDNMKKNIAPTAKIMGVIKTDGYGHGAVPIAKELDDVPYMYGFATATVEEAMILKRCGIKKPILILGYTFPYAYEDVVSNHIRQTVFKSDMAEALSRAAVRLGKKVMVHIKVDTAMSRIGIRPDESGVRFIQELKKLPGIEIEGIFTHFAKADEADKTAVNKQLERFQIFVKEAEEKCNIRFPLKHCSNSAGIVELPDANMDIVRAGITLYGLWPSKEVSRDIVKLKPALSLKSRIVYMKTIHAGEQVSYGGTFEAEHDMRIATIPVGYGDGYPRSLSGKGYVLIRGQKAPIVGRICMDQFMVDVSCIEGVSEYDEVTLIGTDGSLSVTAEELGELSGRFNYELVCGLGKRVPRLYLKEGREVLCRDYFSDYR